MADAVLERLTEAATERSPATTWRELCFVFRDPQSRTILRFAGYQQAHPWSKSGERRGAIPWLDYPELVLRDVQRGCDYWLIDGAERHKVDTHYGLLFAHDVELSALQIPDAPTSPDWWLIALEVSNDILGHCRFRGLDWRDVVAQDELIVKR